MQIAMPTRDKTMHATCPDLGSASPYGASFEHLHVHAKPIGASLHAHFSMHANLCMSLIINSHVIITSSSATITSTPAITTLSSVTTIVSSATLRQDVSAHYG